MQSYLHPKLTPCIHSTRHRFGRSLNTEPSPSRASVFTMSRVVAALQFCFCRVGRIVKYLKTNAAKREIDLHPDIAEFLQCYRAGKSGLLFHTARGTPHLCNNLEDRWLTPRLVKVGLDEEGMGWHSFKRFRKTWLRGARCLEDLNNFWMAHKPQNESELYSHLHEELQMRLEEAERVGYGFDLPKIAVAPNAPKISITKSAVEIAA